MNGLDKIARKIAHAQKQSPWIFIVVFIVLALIIIPGILFLPANIEPSIERLMPAQEKEVSLMNEMREQFGADMLYVVLESDYSSLDDVRSVNSVEYIDLLTEKIRYNEYILGTRSLSSILKQSNNGVLPRSDYEIAQLLEQDMVMMQAKDFLGEQSDRTYVEITADTGANIKIIEQVIDSIEQDVASLEVHNPGYKTKITGFGAIDKATFEVIVTDFTNITGLSFMGMVLFLFFYFNRSLKKTLLTVSLIMLSLLIMMGITGYLDLTITVMTMVAAAMIMALGISYGIHVVHGYYVLRKEYSKKNVLTHLQSDLLRALIGSSLTTSAGFLALLFGVLPAMKILGIVLAIGIVVTLLVAVFFLPALVYVTDKHSH